MAGCAAAEALHDSIAGLRVRILEYSEYERCVSSQLPSPKPAGVASSYDGRLWGSRLNPARYSPAYRGSVDLSTAKQLVAALDKIEALS